MSAPHGCNDDTAVVESFKEALIGRVGADRYRMWFSHGVEFAIQDKVAEETPGDGLRTSGDVSADARRSMVLSVRGQFALDRLRKNFLREIRGAAMQVFGSTLGVQLSLQEPPASQAELPLLDGSESSARSVEAGEMRDAGGGNAATLTLEPERKLKKKVGSPQRAHRSKRGNARSFSKLIGEGAGKVREKRDFKNKASGSPLPLLGPKQEGGADAPPQADEPKCAADRASGGTTARSAMNAGTFVTGVSNRLASTAMTMVCQDPSTASPLFLCGPTGTGKTHLMAAIADQLRRYHRMRRVMHLSAEQFTNDFISSVGNSGITAFRRRYREVDALLIDDVQFLGSKKATLREMLYTVETLANSGRPLVFSGLSSPTDIPGLSRELAGRMAAGLVCPIQPLDQGTREVILRRWIEERCSLPVPEPIIQQVNSLLAGDGRVISGVVNMINTLQRMYDRMPTMDELHRFGGELLRASRPVATLSVIETAVCETFHLPPDTLRSGTQTRAVTGPRMLAMYLARQMTSSAYSEIANHFGGKSHSTAISAENNVKTWLQSGKPIGRGPTAMSAQDAIEQVESLLRSG